MITTATKPARVSEPVVDYVMQNNNSTSLY
jgi:hypothetical protein